MREKIDRLIEQIIKINGIIRCLCDLIHYFFACFHRKIENLPEFIRIQSQQLLLRFYSLIIQFSSDGTIDRFEFHHEFKKFGFNSVKKPEMQCFNFRTHLSSHKKIAERIELG